MSVRLRNEHNLSLYVAAALQCHTQRVKSCILCCSVLQCVAVRFSALQCVVVCCSVLQCVAVCCSVLQCVAVCCSALQKCSRGPSVSHSANQVMHSVLQCVAVCCSVLQCVAVCCSVLQLVRICKHGPSGLRTKAQRWTVSNLLLCVLCMLRVSPLIFSTPWNLFFVCSVPVTRRRSVSQSLHLCLVTFKNKKEFLLMARMCSIQKLKFRSISFTTLLSSSF